MNYQITDPLKEDFYIKLYFDSSVDFDYKGIKRAYLDFNRTLHKKGETDIERQKKRKETEVFLRDKLFVLITSQIRSQDEFDESHKRLTHELIAFWNKLTFGEAQMKVGHAQKWINMTLKYWLLFGGKRINSIVLNARYFHIPIDMYVQTQMFEEVNPRPWSKIENYEVYFEYQLKHRRKNSVNSPLLDEFIFFNNLKESTSKKEKKQNCPICNAVLKYFERYPMYVCQTCADKATDIDGKLLSFGNSGMWGGFEASYPETGKEYKGHICYIDGIECTADEAKFGGIVIETIRV